LSVVARRAKSEADRPALAKAVGRWVKRKAYTNSLFHNARTLYFSGIKGMKGINQSYYSDVEQKNRRGNVFFRIWNLKLRFFPSHLSPSSLLEKVFNVLTRVTDTHFFFTVLIANAKTNSDHSSSPSPDRHEVFRILISGLRDMALRMIFCTSKSV